MQSIRGWHILDVTSIWLKEFAAEFSKLTAVQNWAPVFRPLGHWEKWQKTEEQSGNGPELTLHRFPLQRGYSRYPVSALFPYEKPMLERLLAASKWPAQTGLICTTPFYAPVAERWPGPVVYYQTDLTKKYAGINERQVVELDRRLCRVAIAVCPNSVRIADYFCQEAGCAPAKITVIPNATRASNVAISPIDRAMEAPADIRHLPRPLVGVIGNLGGNMDWELIRESIERAADVSWVFVGPTADTIDETPQREARRRVLGLKGRIAFTGRKPYGELAGYARSFDAAFLPYKHKEPTFSGSATRFYEHLAACRPMLATRGFHELLSKEPLLRLVDSADDVAAELQRLAVMDFQDGLESSRWEASKQGTWQVRARDLLFAAESALHRQVVLTADQEVTA